MVEKVKGGWKIRSHTTGELYPKVYTSKKDAEERVSQMMMFKSINKGK